MGVRPKLGRPSLEGVARPRGLVEEQQKDRLVRQSDRRPAGVKCGLQFSRGGQQMLDLLDRKVACLDVIPFVRRFSSLGAMRCR
jgi:hypothetical protein